MRIQSCVGTLSGTGVGVLAILIWMLTLQPHSGAELSDYLFPMSALILELIYDPAQSIPVPLWYGGALLQWVIAGAVVDILRRAFRRQPLTRP